MPERSDDGAWRALLAPYYAEFGAEPGVGRPAPPFDEAMAEAVEAVRPEAVSFHFGLPERSAARPGQSGGAVVIGNATTVAEARWLAERGVDAIIAQGWEAGGHTGRFLARPGRGDRPLRPAAAGGGRGGRAGDRRRRHRRRPRHRRRLPARARAPSSSAPPISLPGELDLPGPSRGARSEPTLFTNLMTGGLARGVAGRLVRELGPVRPEAPPYPLAASALARSEARPSRRASSASARCGRARPGRSAGPLPGGGTDPRLAAEALAILGGEA
jgi:nitronate monooxygenase